MGAFKGPELSPQRQAVPCRLVTASEADPLGRQHRSSDVDKHMSISCIKALFSCDICGRQQLHNLSKDQGLNPTSRDRPSTPSQARDAAHLVAPARLNPKRQARSETCEEKFNCSFLCLIHYQSIKTPSSSFTWFTILQPLHLSSPIASRELRLSGTLPALHGIPRSSSSCNHCKPRCSLKVEASPSPSTPSINHLRIFSPRPLRASPICRILDLGA